MKEEFNLSEKIKGFGIHREKIKKGYIDEEDVKEFIKRLKEEFCDEDEDYNMYEINKIIDKLAGDKLIEEKKE